MNKRQRAVRKYLLGGCTYLQLEKKYAISKATLNRCVLKYQAQQQAKLKGVVLSSDPMKPKPNQPPSVEQLQKLLEQEQLRNKLLKAMLDIAEDELVIADRHFINSKKIITKPALKPSWLFSKYCSTARYNPD
jgi:transposase